MWSVYPAGEFLVVRDQDGNDDDDFRFTPQFYFGVCMYVFNRKREREREWRERKEKVKFI